VEIKIKITVSNFHKIDDIRAVFSCRDNGCIRKRVSRIDRKIHLLKHGNVIFGQFKINRIVIAYFNIALKLNAIATLNYFEEKKLAPCLSHSPEICISSVRYIEPVNLIGYCWIDDDIGFVKPTEYR
jgi:hypothetical protein